MTAWLLGHLGRLLCAWFELGDQLPDQAAFDVHIDRTFETYYQAGDE